MTQTELINYWIERIKNDNKIFKNCEFKDCKLIQHKNTIWLKTYVEGEYRYFYIRVVRGKIKWYNGSIYCYNEYAYNEYKDVL